MYSFIIYSCGFFVGFVLSYFFFKRNISGTLVRTKADEDGTYLFLKISSPIQNIFKKKYVVFKVEKEDFLSPK